VLSARKVSASCRVLSFCMHQRKLVVVCFVVLVLVVDGCSCLGGVGVGDDNDDAHCTSDAAQGKQ